MRLTLRAKLLFVSLSLLVLPWAGYRYINEMEAFLRQAQEEALTVRAEAAAALLASRGELFARHAERVGGVADEAIHFVRSLEAPVQVDGYAEEWAPWFDLARTLEGGEGLRVRYLLAARGQDLYALFLVDDAHIRYRDPRAATLGDHLEVTLGADARRYRITTAAPGRLNAYERLPGGGEGRWEPAIRGEWQESATGYTVELRLPLGLAGGRAGFDVVDADASGAARQTLHTAPPPGTGVLLLPDPGIERLVAQLAADDTRAWVVDTAGRVLAVAGRLLPPEGERRIRFADLVLGLFLPAPTYDFSDSQAHAARLTGGELNAALQGRRGSRRRGSPDGRAVIASVAVPIRLDGGVAGAVVVEQTTNAILSLQNRAIGRLAAGALLALGAAAAVLLLFATRLSARIRRLRDATEAAIGPDGRVRGTVAVSRAGDEVGDLSRTVSDLVRRLGEYNRYLEGMAGKLAHELRTPVVVVKSSLENLEHAGSAGEIATYRQRAQEGIERLGSILQRLSEATRLEQALQDSEAESFDLGELVRAMADGYRTAYPAVAFELALDGRPMPLRAAPDLIAQLLDKLVGNAVDFAAPDTPVTIALARDGGMLRLSVSNRGPVLPAEMRERLFDAMVSVRSAGRATPHLGIGLYIVRFIAEFHGGRVEAENLPQDDGVVFSVWLPPEA